MMIYATLKSWLFTCRAKTEPDELGSFYCTLPRRHAGQHEAWTCTCRNGRCEEPLALAETWTD